jgi:hypothetical protein
VIASIFGIRPLVLLPGGRDNDFYGYDPTAGYTLAVVVGLVALTSVLAGYVVYFSVRRQSPGRESTRATEPLGRPTPTIRAATTAALALTMTWLTAMGVVGGGPSFLTILYGGRSEQVERTLAGVPVLIGALPLAGALVLSYVRYVREGSSPLGGRERVLYWAGVATTIVPPLALGTRRYLLPAIVVAAMAASMARGRSRISLRSLVLGAGTFILLAIIPFIRSAGARVSGGGPLAAMYNYLGRVALTDVVRNVFVSFDTEMFNYVAYVGPRLGSSVPLGYGRGTVGELLTAPLPASFGVENWSDTLLTRLFGGGCAEVLCPVASLPGTLLFDGGLGLVAIGMFLFGLLCAHAEMPQSRTGSLSNVARLCFAGFTVVIVRGNPVLSAIIASYALLFAILVLRYMSRHTDLPRNAGRSQGACHV